jgi:4-amino-4-deoxy-L-arabinose transferase-like glycosyltransferase
VTTRSRGVNLAVVILAIALAIRLIATAGAWDTALLTDSADYQRHALSILDGSGFGESFLAGEGPTAFRPPAYPFLMAGVYEVAGVDPNALRVIQAFLGVLTVALIGLIALRIWSGGVALVAMAIAAVYPPLVISGTGILLEPIFLPLELGAVAALLEYRRRGRELRWLLLAGALVGFAALTRPNGLVLLLPLAIAAWPPRRAEGRSRRDLLAPIAACVLALAIVAPWTVRNSVKLDGFVPVTSQFGWALAGTYNPEANEADGVWIPPYALSRFDDIFLAANEATELEVDRELRERALDYLGDHPLYLFEVAGMNTLRMLDLTGFEHPSNVAYLNGVSVGATKVGIVCFYALALLAIAGAFTAAARRAPLFIWVVPIAMALSVIFIADTAGRYRLTIDPFVIMLASLALLAAWDRWRVPAAPPSKV